MVKKRTGGVLSNTVIFHSFLALLGSSYGNRSTSIFAPVGMFSPKGISDATGMLLRLTVSLREMSATVYFAFNRGSSQLGKALHRLSQRRRRVGCAAE